MFLCCHDKNADTVDKKQTGVLDFKENIFKEFDIKKMELWRWEGRGLDQLRHTIGVL